MNGIKKTYKTLDDVLFDERFIEWRLTGDAALTTYWQCVSDSSEAASRLISEAADVFKRSVKHVPQESLTEEEKHNLYNRIMNDLRPARLARVRTFFLYTAAAAAGIALIVALWGLWGEKEQAKVAQNNSEMIIGQELSNEDIRIISDNQTHKLPDEASLELTGEGKAMVAKQNDTEQKEEIKLAETKTNTMIVPFGKRSQIVLSDGTRIWLNAGTELDFPAHFNGSTREITLRGEAFIEVAKQSAPFIVHTADYDVRVYGTRFNVTAYRDESARSVVLVEGKVGVEIPGTETKVEINPGEMFSMENSKITKSEVDINDYISWKDGIMILKEMPVMDVLKRIGRYYNIQFDNAEATAIGRKTCFGKLYLAEDINEVMQSISAIANIDYRREDNRIYLTKK